MSARSILARSPAALAGTLWFASTFFFLGDTGKHSDDYWVAMRNMATGGIDWARHPWVRWPYFWRPLHLGHCSLVNTISWDHPWIGHLELAVIHGVVAWMLAGLIARLGVRREIAWLAALLFMVCPLNGEAALWTSASCNAISSLFLLRSLELVRRQGVGPSRWVRDLWIGMLAFVTACWYEPAAAALAGVPLVYHAVGGSKGVRADRWWGMIRCTAAAGLGCALYEGLFIRTAPAYVRGGTSSFVAAENGLSRTLLVGRGVLDATVGGRAWEVIAGSIEQGWSVLLHTPAGAAFLVIVPALAIAAFVAMRRRPPTTPTTPITPISTPDSSTPTRTALKMATVPDRRVRTGLLIAAGLMISACAWLPIIAIEGQRVELRTLYVPMLGTALCVAAAADWMATRLASAPIRAKRAAIASAAALALAAAVAGSIGMIGFQAQFRGNARIDRRTVERLAELLPNPAPGTIFLPLRIDARGSGEGGMGGTGRDRYDHAIHGAFETPYCCAGIVCWVFHRTDISGAPTPWWMRKLTPEGFSGLGGAPPIPWERCVPFVVGADGAVRIARRVRMDGGDGALFEVEFPRVAGLPADALIDGVRLREIKHAHCVAELAGE